MKIACEACGAKYTIADDKVRGRKVKIRCKGCGTPIVVDGQQGGGPSVADVETDATLEPVDGPVIWSVNLSDTDSRTMTVDEIVAGYSSGLVTSDAFVWKDGMTDWVAVLDSELAPFLHGAPPAAAAPSAPAAAAPPPEAAPLAPVAAAPSATAPVAAARGTIPQFAAPNLGGAPAGSASRPAAARPAAVRAQAQPDNTQDLFGGIDAAGSDEDEVATSAPFVPQAGSSAYDDGKMTGARNENSVLFSLDALKAGFSPSAPAANAKPAPKAPKGPPGGRPQQPSNPDDPFGMGASAGLGGIGGGALFGADNHALLTAPAPPPPPPPTPAQVASGVQPMYAPPPPKNKLVLIGGGVGGVVIIGLLAALVFGKKHDAGPGTDGSALTSASAAPEKAPEAKKEDTPPPPAEDKPAESAAASASASPSASAVASASAKPTDKPVAVAAKTDATKKPKEDAPPPADAPPFSKASAISALSAAAAGASSCKKPGGPTGSGKATVTFAPSGRATTATVAGSFAGTPVGGCVASVFRRAHVPAFSGSSVTVSKSFSIN
jgi:predicted Zn finger-like uncharacterized protein